MVILLIVAAITWFKRKNARPFAWDVGLAAAALWVIWTNREEILAAIELSRFRSEVSASGNAEQTLATFETRRQDDLSIVSFGCKRCARNATIGRALRSAIVD